MNARLEDKDSVVRVRTSLTLPWTLSTLQRLQPALLHNLHDLSDLQDGLAILARADPRRLRLWLSEHLGERLSELASQFGWMTVFLRSPALEEDYFLRELSTLSLELRLTGEESQENMWLRELQTRTETIAQYPIAAKARAESAVQQLELSKYEQDLVEAYRLAMDARNEAEYQLGLGSLTLHPVIAEICSRIHITEDIFNCIYDQEIVEMLNGQLSLDDIPMSRIQTCGNWFADCRTFNVMSLQDAVAFQSKYGKVSLAPVDGAPVEGGMGASGGVAEGPVCLVYGLEDLQRFRKGDILVAENTLIDYVPWMRLAAGVISEEGVGLATPPSSLVNLAYQPSWVTGPR